MSAATITAALDYAERGWRAFPVDRQKHPLTPHGFKDASTDPEIIRRWWTRWPWAGVAVATGAASGIIVADLDTDRMKGIDGVALAREHRLHLPPGPVAITPRGGEHHIYQHPDDGREVPSVAPIRSDWPGIDRRADGGYVVLPPGPGRRWVDGLRPGDIDIPATPDWLLSAAPRAVPGGPALAKPVSYWRALAAGPVPEGGRNNALARLTGHLLRHRVDPYAALALLQAWAKTACTPPLDPDEVRRTVESVAAAEARRRGVGA